MSTIEPGTAKIRLSQKKDTILPTQELVIFNKFRNNWAKIKDFLLIPYLLHQSLQSTSLQKYQS